MKLLGIDLGDVWIGMALSDGLGITCKPYKTIQTDVLYQEMLAVIRQEGVTGVIVGLPQTVSGGTASIQTNKVIAQYHALKEHVEAAGFNLLWELWDERYSSQRASVLQKGSKSKTKKQDNHALAASFILQSYLDYLAFKKGL